MASRIAALQAKLGGGAMIMGGMRPGARPMRKKKERPRRASLDNSALLSRSTVNTDKRKRKTKLITINFDELEEDEKTSDQFQESMSDNINMDKTKPISNDKSSNNKPNRYRPKGARGGMGGMGGMLSQAGALRKRKPQKKQQKHMDTLDNLDSKRRDRTTSKSFSQGVTSTPLIPSTDATNTQNNPKPDKQHPMAKSDALANTRANYSDIPPPPQTKPSGLRCDLVKEEMGSKTVRLFETFEKYFVGRKGDNGKGMVLNKYVDNNFKDIGIGIGWKLNKLGKKNVSKSSYFMLRNQLMAQASTAKRIGYELTFVDITIKPNSSSQPNSPNISNKKTKTNNIPTTTPLKPVSAPKQHNKPQQSVQRPTAPLNARNVQVRSQTMPQEPKGYNAATKGYNIAPKQGITGFAAASKMAARDNVRKGAIQKNNTKTSSYHAPKTCELVNMEQNHKKIRLYQDYEKYFTAQGANGNKGFAVKDMKNNEFGSALKKLGIDNGWIVTECGNRKYGNKMFTMLKTQISAAAKMGAKKGYVVLFEKATESTPSTQQRKPVSKQTVQHRKPQSMGFTLSQTKPSKQRQPVSAVRQPLPQSKPVLGSAHSTGAVRRQPVAMASTQKKPQASPSKKHQASPSKKPQTIPSKKPQSSSSPKIKPLPVLAKPKTLPPIKKKPVVPPLATASKVSTTDKHTAYNTNKDAAKKDDEKSAPKRRPKSPRSPKLSVDMVKDEGNRKTLKLYNAMDQYIVGSAVKGPKGYKITGFNRFGGDLKNVGIDIGWKLVELGGKDVSKKFYQMTRNALGVEFKNSRKKGYVVTFAAPE